MRKGRSQRKTRGSLPPLTARPPHASSGAGEAAPPRSRGPQVVIGLTAPRSEDTGETRETRAPEATTRSAVLTVADLGVPAPALEILAEPTLELVREAERLELVRETHETGHETAALETVDSLAGVEREAVSDPFAFALSEPTPPVPVVHVTALPTPDEISIPPMGDLSVEPMAERFFSEGELAAARGEEEEETWDQAPDKVQRKSHPHVIERRQRFSRYVRWAVGGAAVVCLAALARTTMMPKRAPASAPVTVAAALPQPVAVAAAPAETAVSAPKVDVPKAEEPKVAEAPKAAEAPKVEEAKPAAATTPPAPGDKTALEEKKDARRNLERGKLAEAIEAGERSVALDPTDGEAWLLLGASYQEKGKIAEAQRCYKSCLKEGKRGPIGECRQMIR